MGGYLSLMELVPFDFNRLSHLPRIIEGESKPNRASFDLGGGKRLDLYVSMEMDGQKAALLELFGVKPSQQTVIDFFAANHDSRNFTASLISVPGNRCLTKIFRRVDRERESSELWVRNYVDPIKGKLDRPLHAESYDQEVRIQHHGRGKSWHPWKIRFDNTYSFPFLKGEFLHWGARDDRNSFGDEVIDDVYETATAFALEAYGDIQNGKPADFSRLNTEVGMNFQPWPSA